MQLKKPQLVLMMVSLCFAAIAVMGDMIIIPIADFLYTTYDNVGAVSYMLSVPALISAVVSAFVGKIIEKTGARKTLIVGFGIFTLSAVTTVFSQLLPVLLIARTLQGVGMGTLGVCAIVIISEHFTNEKRRSSMVGIYNGMGALIGAALGMLSGIVAASGWTNVFYLYLVTIPIFILLFFFIPKDSQFAEGGETPDAPIEKGPMSWGIVVRVAAGFFAFNLIYNVVYYQIAVIIIDKGIVDTAFVGLISALGTIGAFVACSTFGLYLPRIKRFTITLAYLLLALFFTVLYFASDQVSIAVACTFLGATFGIGLSYYLTYATMIVPPEHIPVSTSIATFGMGIATFLAAYLPYIIMAVMGTQSITNTIPPMVIFLVIGTALSVVFGIKERHYFSEM